MQDSPIIRVHIEQHTEDRYTAIQLTDAVTAEEVCRSAVQKLVGNVSSGEMKEYGLILRTRNADMKTKERKFAPFEIPLHVLVLLTQRGAPPSLEIRFHLSSPSLPLPSPQSTPSLPSPPPTVFIKEGPLKLRGKRKFKDRYFILTRLHIIYAHSQKTVSQLSAVISLEDVTVSV